MYSANKRVLLLFQFGYFFNLSSCLISLGRLFNIMLNRSGESRHPCVFLDYGEKAFTVTISCEFFVDYLDQIKEVPFYS